MSGIASEPQRRLFFALCNQLGYDPEECKERAKKRAHVKSFTELTSAQLSRFIELLQDQINTR